MQIRVILRLAIIQLFPLQVELNRFYQHAYHSNNTNVGDF